MASLKEFEQVKFVLFKSKKQKKSLLEENDVINQNEVHFYLLGHRKKYHGKLDSKHIFSWF